ncbi:leucine-rich repeat protein [Alistipes senegalensis]|uniref:leucine-rich repeat protein n=1 Tax=Alistipes senegalensis TaxID=1288121 RepID=UPI0018AC0EC3|nr:leucine-rich repeat protein [Alistipes senegalensis]
MKKKFIGTGTIRKVWIACSMVCACMFGLSACGDDYDDSELRGDIENLEGRITALEEWQKSVNTDIRSLQSLVAALEDKDYVTAVTPLEDGTGYVISFLKSGNVTIKHGERGEQGEKGEDGTTPVISVKQDSDGKHYWTVNGEWLLDNGSKMPVTGEKGDKGDKGDKGADAIAPQVRINTDTNLWEISTDGGKTWTSTGVKATGDKGNTGAQGPQGDAIFAKDGIDYTSDLDNVIFTLVDGTKITLPRTSALTVGFESYETFMLTLTTNVIDIVLPETLKEEDYTALVAEVKNEAGVGMDFQTRAASSPWQVKLTKPTFTNGKYQNNAKVTVTATGANNGDKAILKITLIDNRGKEISASRVLEYFNGVIVDISAGELSNVLSGITLTNINALKVTGTLNETDFKYIRENLTALEVLDLSGTNMTVFPNRALAFYNGENTTLKEVILPEGLISIEEAAFANCTALEKLNVPSTVNTLGRWILENTKVTSFTIPQGVTEIPASCFYRSAITTINIPSSVKTIGNWAFQDAKLTEVVIPSSVTSIGKWAFGCENSNPTLQSVVIEANITEIPECCFYLQTKLTSLSLPEGITSIGNDAFTQCKITSLTLPASLKTIGARAFSNNRITQLTIPDKVETIENDAFAYNSIGNIDFPATLVSLHATAFNWKSMNEVICRALSVPQTPQTDEFNNSWRPFYQINENCVMKVPAESLEAYKNAWGQYFKSVETIQE